ncbi:hypothetical protein A8E36_16950, partial [Burkholderia cenocepacia]
LEEVCLVDLWTCTWPQALCVRLAESTPQRIVKHRLHNAAIVVRGHTICRDAKDHPFDLQWPALDNFGQRRASGGTSVKHRRLLSQVRQML